MACGRWVSQPSQALTSRPLSRVREGGDRRSGGLVPALASFVSTRKRTVVDVARSTSLSESSAATGRPYRGIVVPLHYPFTELIFSFRETSGRSLEAKVMDLVPGYGGGAV